MTKEQKQALIVQIRQYLQAVDNNSTMFTPVSVFHDMARVALAALTAAPVTLPDNMPCKGAPQYIWLQVGCDTGNSSEWPEHPEAGVTWHTDQIHSDDVLYVRANSDEVQE